jgi:hypothetical protein
MSDMYIYVATVKYVAPQVEGVRAAMNDFNPTDRGSNALPQWIVDGPGEQSYPLSLLAHTIQRKDYVADDCLGPSTFLDFVTWGLTNEQIGSSIELYGYTSLTTSFRIRVVNQLSAITCTQNGVTQRSLQTSSLTGTGPLAPHMASWAFYYAKSVSSLTSQYFGDGLSLFLF